MEITIARRFCGPPNSGNGGYSAGRIAALVGNPAEVTLRSPPPLDAPLRAEVGEGTARVWHGETLVGEGRAVPDFQLDLPAPPSWDEAVAAGKRYNGFREHKYGTCFVCGPQRRAGDGLCIYTGPWQGSSVAGTWLPDLSLADASGNIAPEFLWAAIDCPGSWSVIGRDDTERPVPAVPSTVLLGRLTGRILRSAPVTTRCVAAGWFLGAEGRKFHVGSGIWTEEGIPLAYSRGTWITLKD